MERAAPNEAKDRRFILEAYARNRSRDHLPTGPFSSHLNTSSPQDVDERLARCLGRTRDGTEREIGEMAPA